jgi:hypothetical protein
MGSAGRGGFDGSSSPRSSRKSRGTVAVIVPMVSDEG